MFILSCYEIHNVNDTADHNNRKLIRHCSFNTKLKYRFSDIEVWLLEIMNTFTIMDQTVA